MEEVGATALNQFFHSLPIKAHSVLFLIVGDTIVEKTGKKIPRCASYIGHTKNEYVFGHQRVLLALLYKDFLLPRWAKLSHLKGTKELGSFKKTFHHRGGITTYCCGNGKRKKQNG